MSGVKLDILWSPIHLDRFITVGTEIHLYQIEECKVTGQKQSNQDIQISDSELASVLCIRSDHPYLKCVAWYPKCTTDLILALGLASGKIVFTSLEPNSQDSQKFVGIDLVPKQARQCNGVAWNPVETNLISCGLEKHRSDNSVLVWDLNRPPMYHANSSVTSSHGSSQIGHSGLNLPHHLATSILNSEIIGTLARSHTSPAAYNMSYGDSGTSMINKPIFEVGLSETAHSLHWFYDMPKTLIVGSNNKSLKLYDIRDSTKEQNVASTKAVHGVCVDPRSANRVASFVDNHCVIWDIRNFEKPVVTLTESKPITKLAWCPTRTNLLSTLTKDSSVVMLYDIQSMSHQEEIEPAIIERNIQPFPQSSILSFSWHPTIENRMLTITPTGNIKNVKVSDRIVLTWSPFSTLTWSSGADLYVEMENEGYVKEIGDISVVMKQRALRDYGMKLDQLWQNPVLSDDTKLKNLWNWLHLVKTLSDDSKCASVTKNPLTNNKSSYWIQGVHSIIHSDDINGGITKSELVCLQWDGIDGPLLIPSSKAYRSDNRDRAFQLCGWGSNKDVVSFDIFLENLVSEGEIERAATIAVFNLKIKDAIQILHNGASISKDSSVNFNAVAMALSGYTEQKNTLWREMCSLLRTKLGHPYLSAMFAFLSSENYEDVLNEPEIDIKDKVAFACMFLSDIKLQEYLDELKQKVIKDGDLNGILITGLSKDGIDLIQNYVDKTGDVQTASLVILQAFSCETVKDVRPQQWIDSYRDLLDHWGLWHQRAIFDGQYYKVNVNNRPAQQVSVSCNFCGKSVSALVNAMAQARQRPLIGLSGPSSNRNKVSCCPGCRKPLPRCALCLINMGTASGSSKLKKSNSSVDIELKRSSFSNWFTWCQTCRHGGHADHMTEWFRLHKECPVTSCSCKCMCMSSVRQLAKAQPT